MPGKTRDRTREAILTTVLRLMQDNTWPKISIEFLAQEAGVVKSTIFNHFGGGKTEILAEAIAYLFDSTQLDWSGPVFAEPTRMRSGLEIVLRVLRDNENVARHIWTEYSFGRFEVAQPVLNAMTKVLTFSVHARKRGFVEADEALEPDELAFVLLPHLLIAAVHLDKPSFEGARLRYCWTLIREYYEFWYPQYT